MSAKEGRSSQMRRPARLTHSTTQVEFSFSKALKSPLPDLGGFVILLPQFMGV